MKQVFKRFLSLTLVLLMTLMLLPTDILLTTGQTLPIARRKLGEIKEQFLTLMQRDNSMLF